MLRLSAIEFKKIWGRELWLASTYKTAVQGDFLEKLGHPFPLLVKIIETHDFLSVQVHPDDETAKTLEKSLSASGKTECWYVLDATDESSLVYGLKNENGLYLDELKNAILRGDFEKYFNVEKVKKGDFIYISAGTVHAIGKGLTLLEVQQSSDLTYRLFDWGRGREVHIEKSLKSIKNVDLPEISQFSGDFSCPFFSLEKINIKGGYGLFVSKNEKNAVLLFIIDGEGVIHSNQNGEKSKIEKNEIFAVFPNEKISIEGNVEVMKIMAK